jgi:hypothetical protein
MSTMNADVWDVTDQTQAIIRDRVPVDARHLRDPDVPLEQLVRA